MIGSPKNKKSDASMSLRDSVLISLRQSILTGEMKPGERLMEIPLSKKMDVSRTPIREAIRILELEGLVTMTPRKGVVVAQISEESLRDVLEVRRALDKLAITLACERITEEEIAQLNEAGMRFAEVIGTKDVIEISRADVAFHDIITKASKNEKLQEMMSSLSEEVYRFRFEYIKDADHHTLLVEEHKAIYEAIRNRDVETAVHVSMKHIDNQEHCICQNLNFKTFA